MENPTTLVENCASAFLIFFSNILWRLTSSSVRPCIDSSNLLCLLEKEQKQNLKWLAFFFFFYNVVLFFFLCEAQLVIYFELY